MLQHEINHRGDARGGRHLDGGPQAARDDLRINLVDVVLLAQLAILRAGHGRVDDDDVLQGLRHGILEHVLQGLAIVIELQIVHEELHLRAMPGIADGLVVHRLAARTVAIGERSQAA